MSVIVNQNLEYYNCLIKGLQWWINFEERYKEYGSTNKENVSDVQELIKKTKGIEGDKLRLKLLIQVKQLDYILSGGLLRILNWNDDPKFTEEKILGRCIISASNSSFCSHFYQGFELMVADARFRQISEPNLSPWWPYCKLCPPRGINCLISFSYDFLDIFSDIGYSVHINNKLLNKIDPNKKTIDLIHSSEKEDFQKLTKNTLDYLKWLDSVQEIFDRQVLQKNYQKGSIVGSIENLIIEEIKSNFISIQLTNNDKKVYDFAGWPVAVKKSNRICFIDKRRPLLKDFLETHNRQNPKSFSLLRNLNEKSIFDSFINSEALSIDPFPTVFILKYLISCKFQNGRFILTSEYVRKNKSIIEHCLRTILFLYDESLKNRKQDVDGPNIKNFEGNYLNDGMWLCFEYSPNPGDAYSPEPDYSLNSTIDIANVLLFIALSDDQLDNNIKNKISDVTQNLQDYLFKKLSYSDEEYPENIMFKRLDSAHWHDQHVFNCNYSDITGTIKKIDFLLNRCLYFIINNDLDMASRIFENEKIDYHLNWLISQQDSRGFWPPISNELLKHACIHNDFWNLFEDYFNELGINEPNVGLSEEYLNKEEFRIKRISYGNTVQSLTLIAKYFYLNTLLDLRAL